MPRSPVQIIANAFVRIQEDLGGPSAAPGEIAEAQVIAGIRMHLTMDRKRIREYLKLAAQAGVIEPGEAGIVKVNWNVAWKYSN